MASGMNLMVFRVSIIESSSGGSRVELEGSELCSVFSVESGSQPSTICCGVSFELATTFSCNTESFLVVLLTLDTSLNSSLDKPRDSNSLGLSGSLVEMLGPCRMAELQGPDGGVKFTVLDTESR